MEPQRTPLWERARGQQLTVDCPHFTATITFLFDYFEWRDPPPRMLTRPIH